MYRNTSTPADDNGCGWFHLSPARTPRPAHSGRSQARWAVLGAGFTGLAAARQLALKFPHDEIVLIEGQSVGQPEGAAAERQRRETGQLQGPLVQLRAVHLAEDLQPVGGEGAPAPAAQLGEDPAALARIAAVGAIGVEVVEAHRQAVAVVPVELAAERTGGPLAQPLVPLLSEPYQVSVLLVPGVAPEVSSRPAPIPPRPAPVTAS